MAQGVETAGGLAAFQFDYRLKYKGSLIKNDGAEWLGAWGLGHGVYLKKSFFEIFYYSPPHAPCPMPF